MRTDTPCFAGFIRLLSDSYDVVVTENFYHLDVNDFITHWDDASIENKALVYSQAWNDAARSYKSFRKVYQRGWTEGVVYVME